VDVSNLLGGEGEGWSIAMATAGFERGLMLRSPARFQETASKLLSLYFKNKDNLSGSIESKVLQSWLRAEAYALNIYQTASNLMAGKKIGPESSLGKVFWSELDHQMHQTALDILGVSSELEEVVADDVASWIKGYMFSYSGPIYAGTNEIQKNIIAERLLGMPR